MSLFTYLKESKDELFDKVTWPSRRDLQKQTIVVAVSVLIFSLITTGVDAIFSGAIRNILTFLN